ncbi:FAD-binding protein [Variovorax sp. V213]|uniref:electron transfer flavoprotein subunit alpha/FixB family protein n=1 Tax=Variovorax sp. V213 TaxID=3065955 RepID=UPI0034E8BE2F
MTVLVIADVNRSSLATDSLAKTITAVKGLGEVHILIAGDDCEAAAAEASGLTGVANVLIAANPAYAHGMAEATAALVVSLSSGYSHICGASTAFCKSVLPRVAALLDVMVISDVISVIDGSTFERPIYAGNAIQTVVAAGNAPKVFTVRTAGFAPVQAGGAASLQAVSGATGDALSVWVEDKVATSDRPELTSANIVVSGGRGLGSEANFALVEALADKMGAAVGASRAAVDSGFAPNDLQVGQTGKIVAPQLYIAVGISGAIQHLAGMRDSKVIVAINSDPDAPIFQVADYGLVANLFEAIPELESKL